ncbi:hypothetical protein IQ26_07001 [Mesorhizobium tianshanense]|uniref:Uncharacterized protein n=1 Tax=Mesorhizobium tianshanense TaxID=39844 RepID=A0A562MKG0_9HYPH|nr:hypothetical protein IQ26_07001 [Mesorhizobium tianshanense]
MTDSPYPIVAADDFARRFSMRPGGLMWLLGLERLQQPAFPRLGT